MERWIYGPETPAVRRFLQRFAALGPAEWDAIADSFAEIERSEAYRVADAALAAAIERTGRQRERDAIVGPLLQITRVVGQDEPHPAAAAALAAALALATRDALDPGPFGTLYGAVLPHVPAPST